MVRVDFYCQRRVVVKQHIKSVVLVHGAFADGSGWKAVANILKNDGYKVSVAQPPETSYADDQKYTKAAIDAMGGPVVLVGHSYGGATPPRPGTQPNQASPGFIVLFLLRSRERRAGLRQDRLSTPPSGAACSKPKQRGRRDRSMRPL